MQPFTLELTVVLVGWVAKNNKGKFVAITQHSHFVQLGNQQTLHLRRIANDKQAGPVVFFMHGAVENGKIKRPSDEEMRRILI